MADFLIQNYKLLGALKLKLCKSDLCQHTQQDHPYTHVPRAYFGMVLQKSRGSVQMITK